MRNLKFLASTIPEILGRSQNSEIGSRDPHITLFNAILHFFPLELTALRLHAKFEVSSFNRSRDIGGPKIPKLGHLTPHDPFWRNFAFFPLELTALRLHAKLEFSSFKHSRDIRGGLKIPKLGHVTPTWPLLTQFCIFPLELTALRLYAKFEVSSSNRSRDIRGVPKCQNFVMWPPHDPFWRNFAFFR